MRTSSAPHTVETLAQHVREMGIGHGDVVLVRAALKQLGKTAESSGSTLVRALLSVVGDEGGILGLAFTQNHFWPRADSEQLYHRDLKPTTGGFAATLVAWPGSVRSAHPTNSWIAIGRGAAEVIANHGPETSCFEPIAPLVERRGKMLLAGCAADSPGFSTVHWAQHQLALSKKNVLRGLLGAAYEQDGELRVYRKQDTPGCSMGFSKFYAPYVEAGVLTTGYVGDAYSLAIRADQAIEVERAILERDPRFALCDRPDCFSCRGSLLYNKREWPRFYARHFPVVLRQQWRKIVGTRSAR